MVHVDSRVATRRASARHDGGGRRPAGTSAPRGPRRPRRARPRGWCSCGRSAGFGSSADDRWSRPSAADRLRRRRRHSLERRGPSGGYPVTPHAPRKQLCPSAAVESLFGRLEPLLAQVQKPIQYVGGELNSTVKDWDACDVRWALMYPDAYEVGVPNQGVMILYEVLNEQDGVLAERTYSVWQDMEALMREHDVPQFTVDAHRPVGAFDVLGAVVRDRARLHQHAARPRARRHPVRQRRPRRQPPDRHRRRSLGIQPRAGRRLHRRCGARRRRADRAPDHRDHPRRGKPKADRVAATGC